MMEKIAWTFHISIRNFKCVSIQAEQFFLFRLFFGTTFKLWMAKISQVKSFWNVKPFRIEFIDYIYYIIWREKLFNQFHFSGFSSCIQHCYRTNKQKEKKTNESEHKKKWFAIPKLKTNLCFFRFHFTTQATNFIDFCFFFNVNYLVN